jgi:hypothetical protein
MTAGVVVVRVYVGGGVFRKVAASPRYLLFHTVRVGKNHA